MDEREQLEQAISSMEQQRPILGDAVVDVAISALRERLERLESSARPSQITQQRKQVTVLFADVSGFTAMSEKMDHEEVGTVMNSLWTRVDGAIVSQGGRIDKHIGDAVMAVFGAPVSREDDPARAVRAALRVQSEVEAWKQEFVDAGSPLQSQVLGLRLRIGINTGPALIGTVGTTSEYTVIGDTVNLASRVESAAPAGGILISQNTHRHVPDIFDVTTLEPITVKGKSEPIQVYLVKGVTPRSLRAMARRVEGIRTRTIGREKELERLQSVFQTTVAGPKTQLISIVAEAGTGKSRLLFEFSDWLESQPLPTRVFNGRGTADMAKVPSALLRDILSSAFEIQESDRAAAAREKLERGIQALLPAEGADPAAHFIGQLIGFDYSGSSELSGILGDARQIRDLAFHHLADLVASPAEKQAVVLLLEDIHSADSVSLDFCDYLLKTKPNLPLLIVCSTRAALFESRPEWALESEQRVRLDLQPLSQGNSRELVEEILQRLPEVPASLIDLIVEKAEGSPFYVEELINVLIEGGVILIDGPEWRVELEKLRTLKVPSTLTGLLQARLDTLSAVDREKLQQASVVGRVFWPNVLERMKNPDEQHGEPGSGLSASLTSLRAKELIFQNDGSAFAGTPEFIFKNAVLHDVTYESVLLRLRRVYHIQVAEGLIRLGGDRVVEYAGRIGEHYELAGEPLQAARWYLDAGKQAQDTYASDAAASYYEKSLNFFRQHGDPQSFREELEVCRRLGEVMIWQARYIEAIANYRTMFELAEKHGDALSQLHALLGTSMCLSSQGDHRPSMDFAKRAEDLASRANAAPQLAKALFYQGLAHYRLGEVHAGLARTEQSLEINRAHNDRKEMVRCMNLLGGLHHSLGHYPHAQRYMEDALALSEELGDRRQVMDLLNNLGAIAEARGDSQTAYLRYQSALELAREIDYRDGEIVFLTNRGGQQVALGKYEDAEADLRSAVAMAGKDSSWILPMAYYYLADALVQSDKCEEALAVARKSLALAEADGATDSVGAAYRALGVIARELGRAVSAREGEAEERGAAELFQESVRILEEAGMDGERARTLREWARYELRNGNHKNGAQMWRQARELFGQAGAEMEAERMADLPA